MDVESQNAQDARVDALWATLDTRKQGSLDLAALKKGLWKLDHPLKNADQLLADVVRTVDTNGDGRIQYSEFSTFVKQTEKELWSLFKSIDHNNDGKLDRRELSDAFTKAGLIVPNSKLERFFNEVDTDRDGVISFNEWRDFLLFMPGTTPNLKEVMSYFSSTMRMNQEGDVQLSDDVIDGLGIPQKFLNLLFGEIIKIAKPPSKHTLEAAEPVMFETTEPQAIAHILPPEGDSVDALSTIVPETLTPFLPNAGYFVAGGVAGIVSRTSTAPLDRLKVYLIAQTNVTQEAVQAAKSGAVWHAVKRSWANLACATKELWQAGGMRSLYAGNGLNVLKVMPESAIKFGSYEAAKRLFAKFEGHNDSKAIHSWSQFVAGGVAGMVSQFCVYPVDTLKFRLQCETVSGGLRGNKLIIATAKKMWQANGLQSFYRGLPMGVIGIFPYAAIDLGTFEYLKRSLTVRNAKKRGCHEEQAQPGSIATAAIGGFSGALGASAVYPLNLLRTRLQSQGTVLHPRTYTGIMDVTRQTILGEGWRGLFKGLTPNLLKVVPAVSITYVVYEHSKKALALK